MLIEGRPVKTFETANVAVVFGIPPDSNYTHQVFDVLSIENGVNPFKKYVILKSWTNQKKRRFEIKKRGDQEYAYIVQKGSFERIFKRRGTGFKILPVVAD